LKFEHRIDIPAPKARVRAFLNDFEQAAKCLPGVEETKPLGDDQYEGRIRLKVGPLGFNIAGKARVEARDDGAWVVHGEGKDARIAAGVRATLEATLTETAPEATEVLVQAEVTFSGALGGLGQPVIRKKADAMVQEFAENLRKAVAG
jgi:carbon monoxide dehydrogenase subunit G